MEEPYRSFFDRRMRLSKGNGDRKAPERMAADANAEADERLRLAACALLLELAYADDDFSDLERAHIEAVLRRHFSMGEETARELITLAEAERETSDVQHFAALVRASYDLGQKTLLAEIMWGLILSDGEVAWDEAAMLRKIARLLELEPGYLAERRKDRGPEG